MPFPVEGRWITAAEAKLAVRFPASFVTKISKHNGGTVSVQQVADEFYNYTLHPFALY
jgi:hypothetical protein